MSTPTRGQTRLVIQQILADFRAAGTKITLQSVREELERRTGSRGGTDTIMDEIQKEQIGREKLLNRFKDTDLQLPGYALEALETLLQGVSEATQKAMLTQVDGYRLKAEEAQEKLEAMQTQTGMLNQELERALHSLSEASVAREQIAGRLGATEAIVQERDTQLQQLQMSLQGAEEKLSVQMERHAAALLQKEGEHQEALRLQENKMQAAIKAAHEAAEAAQRRLQEQLDYQREQYNAFLMIVDRERESQKAVIDGLQSQLQDRQKQIDLAMAEKVELKDRLFTQEKRIEVLQRQAGEQQSLAQRYEVECELLRSQVEDLNARLTRAQTAPALPDPVFENLECPACHELLGKRSPDELCCPACDRALEIMSDGSVRCHEQD